MGKNNKQRRAQKRRDRGRSYRPPSDDAFGFSAGDLAEIMVDAAAEAAYHGDEERLAESVGGLVALGDHAGRHCSVGAGASSRALVDALRNVWEGGWEPVDVVCAVRKRFGSSAADVALAAVAAEARTSAGPGVAVPLAWAGQLEQLGASVVSATSTTPRSLLEDWAVHTGTELGATLRLGAQVLGVLFHVTALPQFRPPPSAWGRGGISPLPPAVDDRMLGKVRALLAKAESTAFEDEADALTAKAQELMARYTIDHAMVASARGGEVPTGRRLVVDDPYAGAKAQLLSAVADANRCRTVWSESFGFSTIFGFAVDIDVAEVLYTSLLVQATRALTEAGPVRDRGGRSRTRSFRQSFLVAFAARIGQRLWEATDTATRSATDAHGDALLPVLAGRCAAVDDAFGAAFPHLHAHHIAVTNRAGFTAGMAAAELAHLGPEQQLLPGIAV